ncbi:hypothetical protein MTO96_019577 [Rhipicephalus appendiculatus]
MPKRRDCLCEVTCESCAASLRLEKKGFMGDRNQQALSAPGIGASLDNRSSKLVCTKAFAGRVAYPARKKSGLDDHGRPTVAAVSRPACLFVGFSFPRGLFHLRSLRQGRIARPDTEAPAAALKVCAFELLSQYLIASVRRLECAGRDCDDKRQTTRESDECGATSGG